MFYTPHKLQKRTTAETRDEYGRIAGTEETWEDVCPCRCDDNTTQQLTSENGEVYYPKHHVVCPSNGIVAGDYVRCMDGEHVRGEGEVSMVKNTNYYRYTEIWM